MVYSNGGFWGISSSEISEVLEYLNLAQCMLFMSRCTVYRWTAREKGRRRTIANVVALPHHPLSCNVFRFTETSGDHFEGTHFFIFRRRGCKASVCKHFYAKDNWRSSFTSSQEVMMFSNSKHEKFCQNMDLW